ncbi:MAG: TIM barrel protein [Candidatus Hydrogenedentes bacterium]|nr:TIM barrel protein [Candidatus Hydrogenedentota bacterium]
MTRRNFLTAASGTGLVAVASQASAAESPETKSRSTGASARLRLSCPPSLFKGPIEERLEQIAKWGFVGYETLWPEGELPSIRKKADSLGLECSCIVGAGKIAPGGMVNPPDHDQLVAMFKERIGVAKTLGCRRLVGLTGNERADASREEQTAAVIACLKRLAPIADENDVTLVVEALNPLVDHKGYFLTRSDQTMEILQAVNSPRVKMLFDIYHQQITEGNVIRNLTQNIDYIGHFHVADNPGRHEPGTGELNYANIFKAIAETKFEGFVAMEFGPLHNTEEALERVFKCLDWT